MSTSNGRHSVFYQYMYFEYILYLYALLEPTLLTPRLVHNSTIIALSTTTTNRRGEDAISKQNIPIRYEIMKPTNEMMGCLLRTLQSAANEDKVVCQVTQYENEKTTIISMIFRAAFISFCFERLWYDKKSCVQVSRQTFPCSSYL